MPADPKEAKNEELNFELRKTLSDAYAFVEGQKTTQTLAAVTFEELMDQQIERLIGADTEARPNVLHRLEKLEQSTLEAVAKVKSLPPEVFIPPKEQEDVNTPVEPPED